MGENTGHWELDTAANDAPAPLSNASRVLAMAILATLVLGAGLFLFV